MHAHHGVNIFLLDSRCVSHLPSTSRCVDAKHVSNEDAWRNKERGLPRTRIVGLHGSNVDHNGHDASQDAWRNKERGLPGTRIVGLHGSYVDHNGHDASQGVVGHDASQGVVGHDAS